ncbi:MAG: amino acid permease [Oscillospiraceae bacterium]|nr:amino acid permease [Oscillospiraceae bacterium]
MENKLTKKYGLLTAICMVVGTVIGSGIFFRNETILAAIGGRMWIGVAAWTLGGLIALSAAYVFAVLATKYEKTGGLLDYSDALIGKGYGYIFGWFLVTIFFPALTGILAWVSARFTVILFGWDANPMFSGHTYVFALLYLIAIYVLNLLSPKLAGKFQVSTTFLKIIPLVAMGIIGTIVGLSNGTTVANLSSDYVTTQTGNPFLVALVATVFAYLGWETAMTMNAEIKNSKRNLPIALTVGLLIVITIYVMYFVGVFSAAPVEEIAGGEGVLAAFVNVFTNVGGTVLFVFIVISCLGTLNGLVMGGQRALYSLAVRSKSKVLGQVDESTNAPHNAGRFIYLISCYMDACLCSKLYGMVWRFFL